MDRELGARACIVSVEGMGEDWLLGIISEVPHPGVVRGGDRQSVWALDRLVCV